MIKQRNNCSTKLMFTAILGLLLHTGVVGAEGIEATVHWSNPLELATPLSGTVAEVQGEVGQQLAKGALLVRLEQSALRAAVVSARAKLAHTTLVKQEADREFERAQELFDRALLSEHDRIVAEMAQAEAESHYQAARAALAEAREVLAQSEIHAPYRAVVLKREVEVGQHIQAGGDFRPLVRVAEAGRRLVRGWIAPAELSSWPPGGNVTVSASGGEYPATVSTVAVERKVIGGKTYLSLDIYIENDSLRVGEVVQVEKR